MITTFADLVACSRPTAQPANHSKNAACLVGCRTGGWRFRTIYPAHGWRGASSLRGISQISKGHFP
jgi:hypothetical protein